MKLINWMAVMIIGVALTGCVTQREYALGLTEVDSVEQVNGCEQLPEIQVKGACHPDDIFDIAGLLALRSAASKTDATHILVTETERYCETGRANIYRCPASPH
jgi:hypothetical protein